MFARIYQPAKTAMQSGMAKTKSWIFEYAPEKTKQSDPLTGWVGGSETTVQVRLQFDTLEEAEAYAKSKGVAYRVQKPHKRGRVSKSYSDNFRHDRVGAWTH
ncbi:MAG: ETC complex I subunit [Parvibaculales bacterium]